MQYLHSVGQPSPLSSSRTSLSPQKRPCAHQQSLPIPPTTASDNHWPAFGLYGLASFVLNFSHKQDHITLVFGVWLLSLSIMCLRFSHLVACGCASFLLMAGWYSTVQMDHLLCIHSPWVVSTFWLLLIVLLWIFVYKDLFEFFSIIF